MRYSVFLFAFTMMFCTKISAQQNKEPWSSNQLITPKILADKILKQQTENILIISVGPDDLIEGSIHIGPGRDQENIAKLKALLEKTPKDKDIVIYCGCCPFDKCPNIRPPFQLLMDTDFTNATLLDLPKNIKVDWLDKDYPVKD